MPEVANVASDPRPTAVRYRVLAFFCLAAAIAYLQRTSIGIAVPQIRNDLMLSDVQMGWVLSAFYWAYALFQIPAGVFGQRLGSRAGLVVSMAVTSLLCALVSICGNFWSLMFAWMSVGLAIAGIFPCCAQSVVNWFPPTERAMPSGFLLSSMSVGGMVAAALTGWLLSQGETASPGSAELAALQQHDSYFSLGSWRSVFALYAIPGFLWALLFGLWFRNRPQEHTSVNAAELERIQPGMTASADAPQALGPTPWLRMLTHPTMLLICGQQFFRAAGYIFYATWFPTYLREVYGVTTAKSGYLTSLPMLGVVLGGIIAGPLCDQILKRTGSYRLSLQLVGATSQFICGLLILLAWFVEDADSAVALITVGSFVFAFGSCTAYSATIHVAQPYVAPTFSTMNMSGNVGAAVCPLAVAWLATAVGWRPVLLFFVAIYALSFLCWLGLNPDHKLFDDERNSIHE